MLRRGILDELEGLEVGAWGGGALEEECARFDALDHGIGGGECGGLGGAVRVGGVEGGCAAAGEG